MSATPAPLPPLLSEPNGTRLPSQENLQHIRLTELVSLTRTWTGPVSAKLSAEECQAALRPALKDDAAASRVLADLGANNRAIVSVYRRYGGTVDGALLRADLLARGLVEKEQFGSRDYPYYRWKRNPYLPGRAAGAAAAAVGGDLSPFLFRLRTGDRAGVPHLRPAHRHSAARRGRRSAAVAGAAPAWDAAALGQRSAVEVVLALSGVFSALAARERWP